MILPITLFTMTPTTWLTNELAPRVSAQFELWDSTYGTIGRDEAGYMIEVSSGGFLMAGGSDAGTGTNRDAWLVRIDDDGNQLWNQSYARVGGYVERFWHVVECSDGGFAATGNAPADILSLNDDVLVLRTDANGNQLWNRTFGGSNSEVGWGIVEVSGGGYAIISETDQYGAGLADMWLIRLDANGNHLWNKTYGGSGVDTGFSLVETSGGFALFGRTESIGAGGSDLWLVRVDASGNHLWNQTYGGTDHEWGLQIQELDNGDFGLSGDTLSFGINSGSYENAFFLRVTATGTHLWNHTYGGTDTEYAFDFKELSDGSFVLAGSTRSFNVGNYDFYVMRTDANGNLLWNQTYGGAENELGRSVIALSTGGFMVFGQTATYGAGLEDFWLLKISDGPTTPTTPTPTTTFPIPGFPLSAIAIALVLSLGIGIIARRRKR